MPGYTITNPPAEEPISLAEAKEHLRVTSSDEDALIGTCITAARIWCENYADVHMITQQWERTCNRFPLCPSEPIRLLKHPVLSVDTIEYWDENNQFVLWDPSNYEDDLTSHYAQVKPVNGNVWPAAKTNRFNAVSIKFTSGFGITGIAVPESYRQAVRLMTSQFFELREPVIVGSTPVEVPLSVKALLSDRVAI